jgi:Zn finger protein HypA/HybF involved in hydrogenase expression
MKTINDNYSAMTDEQMAETIYILHLQNTNGRELSDELFMLGIKAAIEELLVEAVPPQVECTNCGQLVVMVPIGDMCPKCYC